ncbi:MAG: cyclic nucleotide-binding domain-containing protein [Proteobacteria bacterium]|nr:cyclic nucleotide-binding domain-containing protein [Pseudomonadota bacterium]
MIKINRQIFERLQSSVEFFDNFSDKELFTFLQFMNPERFKDNDVICEENSFGDKMYILINGQVQISKRIGKKDGVMKETILATIDPGECFGEMGLIDQRRRSAKATAKGNALLFSISDEMMTQISVNRKFFLLSFKLYKNFAKMLANRLRDSNLKVVDLEARFQEKK